MRINLEQLLLTNELLAKEFGNKNDSKVIDAILAHAKNLGAKFAVLERPYTDLDYSSDYQAFYSGAFKSYPRDTKRLHFFDEDISQVLEKPFAQHDQALIQKGYLGFIVIRPFAKGPIGRTVLRYPKSENGLIIRRAARGNTRLHLANSELNIDGAPFIQQETKVGACAQAAIWMAALPFHLRHRTSRFTIADITRLAVTPNDQMPGTALPVGSTGLTPVQIIRALRGMGFQPLSAVFKISGKKVDGEPAQTDILRYLDSGLPVVMTMDRLSHAITAVGYVECKTAVGSSVEPTYDTFVRAFLVHDDQRGPYRMMPLRKEDAEHLPKELLLKNGDEVLTVEEEIAHMFVPLPHQVFLTAYSADIVAKDLLIQHTEKNKIKILNAMRKQISVNPKPVEDFFQDVLEGKIVRRTYLTSAGRYRHHLAKSTASDAVKAELLNRSLPHYVWVTELMKRSSELHDVGSREIVGHTVINATSSYDINDDLLMAHIPNMVLHRDVNTQPGSGEEIQEHLKLIEIDCPYRGRERI